MTEATPGVLLGVVCAVGAAAGAYEWLRARAARPVRLGAPIGFACLLLALAVWTARWIEAGHLPLFGTYESALSLALAVLAGTALVRGAAWLWPVSCGLAAALLFHGAGYDARAFPLTISERSWIVEFHAVVSWAAFGALAVNAAAAAAWLLSARGRDAFPSGLVHRSLSVGFLLHTVMLASGSLYKFQLFGSAWSSDPVETLGLVAWFGYGALLHMDLMAGWETDRLARWGLGVFVLLIVSYRGIVYFPAASTYHIFDIDLRMHLGAPSGDSAAGLRGDD